MKECKFSSVFCETKDFIHIKKDHFSAWLTGLPFRGVLYLNLLLVLAVLEIGPLQQMIPLITIIFLILGFCIHGKNQFYSRMFLYITNSCFIILIIMTLKSLPILSSKNSKTVQWEKPGTITTSTYDVTSFQINQPSYPTYSTYTTIDEFEFWDKIKQPDGLKEKIAEFKEKDSHYRAAFIELLEPEAIKTSGMILIMVDSLMNDPDSYVRYVAARTLGNIMHFEGLTSPVHLALKDSVYSLISKLNDETEDINVREAAAWALGEIKTDKAKEALMNAAKGDTYVAREARRYYMGLIK